MRTVICPGSFDPVTLGHLDIITRSSKIFDKVIVLVMTNYKKQNSYSFTSDERVEMIRKCTKHLKNVEVHSYDGLLADYFKKHDVDVIVKGLRATSDFEYEFQMNLINKKINPELETMFLTASEKYTFLSSSVVREMASYGADLTGFVPYEIIEEIEKKAQLWRR